MEFEQEPLAGRIRIHEFKRLPPFPRSLVGEVGLDDWQTSVEGFCSAYPSRLNLAQNDCKTFSLQLAKTLTNIETSSLEDLVMVTTGGGGAGGSPSVPDLLDWQ